MNKLKSIGYILNFFPLPSETFISDEIASLYKSELTPAIIYINKGNLSNVHPSARLVLDKARLFHLTATNRLAQLWALATLFLKSPKRIIKVLMKALKHPERWRYFLVLPSSAWVVRNNINFLHAHFAGENLICASIIAEWTGVPYSVTTHRYDIFNDPISLSEAISCFASATIVITISEFNRNFMAEKYGIEATRIKIVHCGIDLSRFIFQPRRRKLSGEKIMLLSIGRLVAEKAQDILLKAVKLLVMRGVPLQLEIIGDGPLRHELVAMAKELGILSFIVFHGTQTEAFVRERLAGVDLFVLSSRSEGLPVVCMEALAMGTPVVATKIFGIPELIEDQISGLLVPPDNPSALAEAIFSFYSDQSVLARAPGVGRQKVESAFERDACTDQLIHLWSEAIINNVA